MEDKLLFILVYFRLYPTQEVQGYRERGTGEVRRGYSILESRYLRQVVTVWKPDEIDMIIIIVVDADDLLEERSRKLATALEVIRDSHLDHDDNEVTDRSLTGLAIRDVETWLIADRETVSDVLKVAILSGAEKS